MMIITGSNCHLRSKCGYCFKIQPILWDDSGTPETEDYWWNWLSKNNVSYMFQFYFPFTLSTVMSKKSVKNRELYQAAVLVLSSSFPWTVELSWCVWYGSCGIFSDIFQNRDWLFWQLFWQEFYIDMFFVPVNEPLKMQNLQLSINLTLTWRIIFYHLNFRFFVGAIASFDLSTIWHSTLPAIISVHTCGNEGVWWQLLVHLVTLK